MSVFTSSIYAKELTDVLGIGVTLNSDGSVASVTGPVIRRVTAAPATTDAAGSLALRSNGTLYITSGGGTWTAIGGTSGTSYPNDVVETFGTTSPFQVEQVYVSASNRFDLRGVAVTGADAASTQVSLRFETGAVTVSTAIVGTVTGSIAMRTGACDDASGGGGSAGGTGSWTASTGAATSTNGAASGNTGAIGLVTGDSTDGNSGLLLLQTGSAGVTRGILDINAATIDTITQAVSFDLIANNASALVFRNGSGGTTFFTLDTTTASPAMAAFARLTTTDGVASGTARVVGGRASATVADSSTITGNGAFQFFDLTYSIPANTLKAGSTIRILGCVRRIAINGADTAQVEVRVGGTVYTLSPAVAAAAGDRCYFNVILTSRAAPGAAVTVVGAGIAGWSTAAAIQLAGGGSAALATNGALTVDVGINMPNNAGNTAALEQLVVDVV